MHVIAAKAVCFKEALSDDFKVYSKNVISNAQVLAKNCRMRGSKFFRWHRHSFNACRFKRL